MNFKIITLNVQGLNDLAAIPILQQYIRGIPSIDILCIQEHKLQNFVVESLGRRLWPQATSWILEASQGYGNDPVGVGAGKGGLATFLAPRWKASVGATGSVMNNKAHWIILEGLPGGALGILNIYTPNDMHTPSHLWRELITALPTSCRWILTGDFNMVESRQDKTNPCGCLLPLSERQVFTALKQHLKVEDHPWSPGSLKFSWDNFRWDGQRILARLDRCYLNTNNSIEPRCKILK